MKMDMFMGLLSKDKFKYKFMFAGSGEEDLFRSRDLYIYRIVPSKRPWVLNYLPPYPAHWVS